MTLFSSCFGLDKIIEVDLKDIHPAGDAASRRSQLAACGEVWVQLQVPEVRVFHQNVALNDLICFELRFLYPDDIVIIFQLKYDH